jgi:hypothetical protein
MRATLLAAVLLTTSLRAQAPDFSGTWRLDDSKSTVVATAGLIGLIPAGAPKTLHITQPSNGTVVIESQINEGHSRIYKPGRESSTPAGQGGAVSMTTKWDGKTLIAEGALKAPNGDTTPVRETVSLSADGSVLIVEVVTTPVGQTAKASSRLVYTKITDVGPCATWPTPCKKFP